MTKLLFMALVMKIMKFYRCEICGNIVTKLNDSGVPVVCCGQPMKELEPGVTDAAQEKHVPAVTVEGNSIKVQVGEVEHPMLEEHFIQFIALLITTRLKMVMNDAGWFKNYDLQEIVDEMKNMREVKVEGTRKRYTTEPTLLQKNIIKLYRL